ncbi:MAG: hypothetical protein H7287_10365 [Thermoleophilia bacterium]|nr:hypothetical protein [Thermoleophilia bacterium]
MQTAAARTTLVASSTVPVHRASETERAAANLTPASRRLLPDALLDAKIGRGTLAGSLNDQVRFRVERTGAPADWKLVADSPAAVAVMQSRAGEQLLRQLRVSMSGTGSLTRVSNLQGFILAKDSESVLAGMVLSTIDTRDDEDGAKLRRLGELGRTKVAGRVMRGWAEDIKAGLTTAGAWNADGWVTFMPDTARAMLTAAGAYRPDPVTEKRLRRAGTWSNYLAGNGPHEVQHSVSRPTRTAYVGDARWIEEGTANVFSRTPVILAANTRASGLNPKSYAGHLAHAPAVDLEWGTWKRPVQQPGDADKSGKEQARNYSRSQQVLHDLVRLAGADFRSRTGRELAFQLLQAKSMRYTPGVLADAIIALHHLDPSVRERLRTRIQTAVDLPHGAADIAREFGIRTSLEHGAARNEPIVVGCDTPPA